MITPRQCEEGCGRWACVTSLAGWFCLPCWVQRYKLLRLGVER